MKHVIEVSNLKRTYTTGHGGLFGKGKQTVEAVKGIDFAVEEGEIFGLLGENGAGKTTTIKMLITLLAPTEGTCKILGYDSYQEAKKIRKDINFVFGGELGVYRRLSAKDNLIYFAGLYNISGQKAHDLADRLLDWVELTDAKDRLVETYSKGMVQRLQIARGLINDPKIILMDEPTVGLDPMGAKMLRELIRKLKAEGKTVLLTTHYMYEADELCDRIGILSHGEMIALDTPRRLKETYGTKGFDSTLEEVFLTLAGKKE